MNLATLRANPGLLVMVALVAIGLLVFGTVTLVLAQAGESLRPILFVGGLFALVVLPQFAYHVGVATGAIPRRTLTWLPAADRGSVYGWVEQESVLAIRDGKFADLAAVFGAGADISLGSDLRAVGGASPFATAQAAHMVVLPPDGSAIVARFTDAAADAAASDYARQALGVWPDLGGDGLRTAMRPAGDVVKFVLVGRTFVLASGPTERSARKRVLGLGAFTSAPPPSDPGSENFWLFRRGVLPALLVAFAAIYVFAFFQGAVWVGAVAPLANVPPATEAELRDRLLAIDAADVPISIAEEGSQRVVATWRFADARWLDLARARQMKYEHRVILELDPESRVVRVTDQLTRFDASAGRGGATVEWRTMRGVTFFHAERGRVFGLQFDAEGKPMPTLDYTWRFDAQEMKAPLIDAVTRAGWQWRPVPWSGPKWLRWLTD